MVLGADYDEILSLNPFATGLLRLCQEEYLARIASLFKHGLAVYAGSEARGDSLNPKP